MESEIIHIEDVAEIIGLTVPSIRGHLRRGSKNVVPKPFRQGKRRLAWVRRDVMDWVSRRGGAR